MFICSKCEMIYLGKLPKVCECGEELNMDVLQEKINSLQEKEDTTKSKKLHTDLLSEDD